MPELSPLPWENVGPQFKKPKKQAAILVDLHRCTGCHACSVGCKTEHEVPLGDFRMRVRYMEPPQPERSQLAFVPMLCMHCQDAPCLNACPTSAIGRLDDGRVVVDEDKCCGNKACISACPYGAIFINAETQKAEKCDMCTHRTEVGLEPACVDACPTDAMKFHDLGDENDPITKMARAQNAKAWKEDAKTAPSVLYINHEKWMEDKANIGVQISDQDEDPIYEQNNFSTKGRRVTPYGIQVVIYLFLAGIAAGAAFFGSLAMANGKPEPFVGGRRSLSIAIACALIGSVFLILDLTRPADFFLILTSANSGSAISWGARILVLFTLSAIFVRIAVRDWGQVEIERGFKGGDLAGLWLLRLAALGLAIYPAFVLRQGDAFVLWQSPLLIPLIAVSAFHAGVAVMLLVSACEDCKRKARLLEVILGTLQLLLLMAMLVVEGGSLLAWAVALILGTLVPLLLVFLKPESALAPRLLLILIGTFAIRHWIIVAGQTV